MTTDSAASESSHSRSAPTVRLAIGANAAGSWSIAFDGLEATADQVIGEVGRGFYHLLDGLNPERIVIAAIAYTFDLLMRWVERRVVPWKGRM